MVIYGGAKISYHGYAINVSNSLFVRPELGCGNDFAMQNDASGVTAPKQLRQFFTGNTIVVGDGQGGHLKPNTA